MHSYERKVIFAFYKEFGEAHVLLAEVLALMSGLILCLKRGIIGFVAEIDSKALVLMVKSEVLARWPLCNILKKKGSCFLAWELPWIMPLGNLIWLLMP